MTRSSAVPTFFFGQKTVCQGSSVVRDWPAATQPQTKNKTKQQKNNATHPNYIGLDGQVERRTKRFGEEVIPQGTGSHCEYREDTRRHRKTEIFYTRSTNSRPKVVPDRTRPATEDVGLPAEEQRLNISMEGNAGTSSRACSRA